MVVAKEIIWVLDWSFGLLSEHQTYILLVLWIRPLNSPFKLSQNWISIQSLPYSKFLLWAKTFNGIVVLHLSTLLVTSSSCCLNDRAIWLEPGTLKGLFEIVNISATIRLDSIGVHSKHNGPIYFRFKIILNSLSQFKYIHYWEAPSLGEGEQFGAEHVLYIAANCLVRKLFCALCCHLIRPCIHYELWRISILGLSFDLFCGVRDLEE